MARIKGSRSAPAILLLFSISIAAADPINESSTDNQGLQKVSYQTTDVHPTPGAALSAGDTYIFSAPPRETAEAGQQKYGPVAEYLTKVLGKEVVYQHPGTWGVYRTKMTSGEYDIAFDGPHFNSYRMEKLNHNILAKIPGEFFFVVIVRKDDDRFTQVNELAGRTFCAHAPPNLGTLTLLGQFSNPSRQPVIRNTKGWKNIYQGLIQGKCQGAVVPLGNLKKFDPTGAHARVLFQANALPNQAFSAGPRVTLEDQKKIAEALTAADAALPTENLRKTYAVGNAFAMATNDEYVGVSNFLANEWGYY